jgi:iron complex outermembrane receptor protein
VSLDTGSGNGQAGGSANLQYGKGPWMAWAGGGARRSGDYDTPLGPVANSETNLENGRGGVSWTGQRAFVSIGAQAERSRYGVPFAASFEAAETGESFDIDLKSSRRDLRVDGGMRHLPGAFADNVKATFVVSDYGHEEIEVADGDEEVGSTFSNDTRSFRLEVEQKRSGRLTGRIGVDLFTRAYRVEGEEVLAPATSQTSFAAFAYEELAFGATRVQFGGRVERNAYVPDARAEGEDHEGEAPPAVRDRSFVGASGSIGVHRSIGAGGAIVANLSLASRAPALEELYNFGPHIGNLAFEIGNPDLEVERSVGVDVSLRRRAKNLAAELNLFTYRISNFVFLDFTGEIADGLREARYVQGDSRYSGLEATGDVQLGRGVHVEGGVSVVRASLVANDKPLPRIPPVSGRIKLEIPWRALTVTPEVVLTAAQERLFDGESPTDGYSLLNLSATYFVVRGHATHALTIKGHNLTNEAYRLHTSLIKELAPEMGRAVAATYTVRFF